MDPPRPDELHPYAGLLSYLPIGSYVSIADDTACVWEIVGRGEEGTEMVIVRVNTASSEPDPIGTRATYGDETRMFRRALLPQQERASGAPPSEIPPHRHDLRENALTLGSLPIGSYVANSQAGSCVWQIVANDGATVRLRIVRENTTAKNPTPAGYELEYPVSDTFPLVQLSAIGGSKGEARMSEHIEFIDGDDMCEHENDEEWVCERRQGHSGPHMLKIGRYSDAPSQIWRDDGSPLDDYVEIEQHPRHGDLVLHSSSSRIPTCGHRGANWYCEREEGHTGPHAVRRAVDTNAETRFWDDEGESLSPPPFKASEPKFEPEVTLTPEDLPDGAWEGGCYDTDCERTKGHDGPHMLHPRWRESADQMVWNDDGEAVESTADLVLKPPSATVPNAGEIEWFDGTGNSSCGHENADGFVCERVAGHDGPHMLPSKYARHTQTLAWDDEERAVFSPVASRLDDPTEIEKLTVNMRDHTGFVAEGIADGTVPQSDDEGRERIYVGPKKKDS